MNDKRIIEHYKTAKRDAKLSEPPQVFTKEEISDLRATALAALEHTADAPRSIRPLSNKPKSKIRLEFEAYLQGIVERWEGVTSPTPTLHQTQPGKPCLSASATVANDSDVPLHELLKQTKLLLVKATRK